MGNSMDTGVLLLGVLFSSIGLGYFVYGRKQRNAVAWLSGISLMTYPLFISNSLLMVGIGVVLVVIPFVIKS